MKSLMSVLEATISGAQGSSVLLRNGLVAPSEADVAGRQILDFHAIPGGPAKGHGVLRMTRLVGPSTTALRASADVKISSHAALGARFTS